MDAAALESPAKLLPRDFFLDAPIAKDSPAFSLYLKSLRQLADTISSLQSRDAEALSAVQSQRLRRVIKHSSRTTWWSNRLEESGVKPRDIRSIHDLQRVAPVNRYDLLDAKRDALLTCPEHDERIVWRRSGGSTTGTPFEWGLNKTILILNVMANFVNALEARGFPFGSHAASDLYLQFNYAHQTFRSEFKWFSAGDWYLDADNPDFDAIVRRFADTLDAMQGAIIRTGPLGMRMLAQEMRARSLKPAIAFFSITGQTLDENDRREAEAYFECGTIVHYGAQEMGPCAIECPARHNEFHVLAERVIVEILDERGMPVPAGTEGLVTVTCLDNSAMPLIRYQPGDVAVLLSPAACECGNAFPLLEIRNRTTDSVRLGSVSRPVSPLMRLFSRPPFVTAVRRFQVRQDTGETLHIALETRESIEEHHVEQLRAATLRLYPELSGLTIAQTSFIPQDGPKFKVFVPLREERARSGPAR
jgi:phenylacetate-CoA ligase